MAQPHITILNNTNATRRENGLRLFHWPAPRILMDQVDKLPALIHSLGLLLVCLSQPHIR